MHFDLHIPDFFSAEGVPPAEGLAAAETLIARGRRRRIASVSPEAWLFGRFGVEKQRDWPVAPYTLLADGGAPERHFWMRADPVHLRVGRDSLVLADGAAFQVSRAESEALVETLNRHFGQTMLFYAMRPARWYVRLEKAPDMQTTPAAAARGLAIDETLPSGPDAMRFHALMNEAQMLLHEHPVNAEREARAEPALNSVWFWGGGVMPAAKDRPFSTVVGGRVHGGMELEVALETSRSPAASRSRRESRSRRCRRTPAPFSPRWGTTALRWPFWTPRGKRRFASAARRSSATGSGRCSPL